MRIDRQPLIDCDCTGSRLLKQKKQKKRAEHP
jgi:hypothetical protein